MRIENRMNKAVRWIRHLTDIYVIKGYNMMKMKFLLTIIFCVAAVSVSAGPKVLLMIEEKNLGTIATSETESMAIKLLSEVKIAVIDQDMVRANQKKTQALMKSVGDARAAAAVGLEFGADIVITGDAVAKPSARRINDTNFRAYEAVVTLKAVRTDNASVLATASESFTKPGLDDVSGGSAALKGASEKSLSFLIKGMMKKWSAESGGSAQATGKVVINAGGMDQLWKLKELREQLKGMTDQCSNVIQQSYTMGAATFEIDSKVAVEELAEELVMNAPEGLKLQVLSITSGKIDLRVVDAGNE